MTKQLVVVALSVALLFSGSKILYMRLIQRTELE